MPASGADGAISPPSTEHSESFSDSPRSGPEIDRGARFWEEEVGVCAGREGRRPRGTRRHVSRGWRELEEGSLGRVEGSHGLGGGSHGLEGPGEDQTGGRLGCARGAADGSRGKLGLEGPLLSFDRASLAGASPRLPLARSKLPLEGPTLAPLRRA
jgi:hypothetical protein